MSDYAPPGTKYYGSTGPDQVQFARSGHTAALPKLEIYKRRQSRGGPTSEFQVQAVEASADADGVVRNTLITLSIRSVSSQNATNIKAILGRFGTMCSNADFQNDAVEELLLPAPVTTA